MKNICRKFIMALFITAIVASCASSAPAAKKKYSQLELAYMPAVQQIKLFKAGVITPSDVLEAQIAQVKKYNGPIKKNSNDLLDDPLNWNGKVNAICFERFEDARKAAKAATLRYKKGTARKLEGITVGMKNEEDIIGWRYDMGSIVLKDRPISTFDSAIVVKLKEAGAIPMFSATVPEFYILPMTWSKLYGVTRNPWNLEYGVGGSSGGSCAALAAGFCTLATGSDMGGSIRIPSSMCGVYGFKPPFGRVPTSDISYETTGPLARNFDDLVIMQDVMCGPSPKVHASLRPKLDYPSTYKSIKGKKVAVCYFKNWASLGLDNEVTKAMNTAVAALKKAGAKVDIIDINWTAEGNMMTFMKGLMLNEYSLIHAAKGVDKSILTPYTVAIFSKVEAPEPECLMKTSELQDKWHAEIQQKVFGKGYIAIVMPTLITPYFPADYLSTPDRLAVTNGKPTKDIEGILTPIWNLLNRYPVVDVPAAIAKKNVPVGVQVVGNTFEDLEAFRVASALSKNLPQLYKKRFPDYRREK